MGAPRGFKGHKQALPRKVCAACAREMVWRRAWARCWSEVRYCSERCRRERAPSPGSHGSHGG